MDSNKYRRGTGTKYRDSSLSKEKSKEFLSKINRMGERKCIAMIKKNVIIDSVIFINEDVVCGKVFFSEGPHNRKCPECKAKQENKDNNKKTRDLLEYKTHQESHLTKAYRGE